MPLKRSGNTFRAGQTGPSSAEDASTMVSPPPQPSSGNAGALVSAPSRAVNDAPSLASAPKLQFEGTLKAAPEMNRPIEMSKPPKAPLYEENGNGAGKGFGRKGKVYVNGEKVIAMRRVWEEVDAKRLRSLLSGSCLRYFIFVVIYFAALHHQKLAMPALSVRQGFQALFVDTEFQHPTFHTPMGFRGLRTEADFWAWYEALFLPAFFDTLWASGEPKLEFLKGALLDRNRIANGVRWTQRRGRLNRCAVAGKYNEFFPFCFPPLYNDARDGPVSKDPFGPYYSPNKYRYNETDIGAGFDDGGFIVSFPFDLAESKQKLAELKSDRWVDEHTQWLRIDFATYNPSASLITQVEFVLEREPTGKLVPRFTTRSIKSELYLDQGDDYLQITLEILVFMAVMMYFVADCKDLCQTKIDALDGDHFLNSLWTWISFLQLFFFVISFIMYFVIIGHSTRGNIELNLGPANTAVVGATADQVQRQFLKDSLTMRGDAINLSQYAKLESDYYAVQAITVLLTLLRALKYFGLSPVLGGLLETLLIAKVHLVQFVLMISSCNICFAYMGYILFGDKLDAFKTFDRSYFSLLGVLVGEGPSYAQLADADGVGAFLLYVPYVLFFALIFTQLVVAVIVEAYQVHLSRRPKMVGLIHQFRFGLARWLVAFRRQVGPDEVYRYDGPDTMQIREWLKDWDWPNAVGEVEMTHAELEDRLEAKNVRREDVAFLFRRYAHCTRTRDPPPPEPEANEMIRELFKQIKTLSDAHAVAQRKLDAILAGQSM